MNDTSLDRTFDSSLTPDEAWRRLEEVSIQRSEPARPDEWWLPGWESTAIEVDRDAGRRLTARKALPPCEDTIIEITFEHAPSGSRIRVSQSGFDKAFIDMVGDEFFTHAEHIFSDFELFLATGVVAQRAWRPWAPLGISVDAISYGLSINAVQEETWAARLGLQVGDILLTACGAPIFEKRDLSLVERVAVSGEEIAATWARDGRHHDGSAVA